MDTSTDSSQSLFGSVKRLLNTAVAGLENRIELFLVELREERFRAIEAFLLGCAVALLGFMTMLMTTVTVVVIFWDTARVPVLIALSVCYCLATVGVLLRLRGRLQNWSSFSATLGELKKDRACLSEEG